MNAPALRVVGGTDVDAPPLALKWRKVRSKSHWHSVYDLPKDGTPIDRFAVEQEADSRFTLWHYREARGHWVPTDDGLERYVGLSHEQRGPFTHGPFATKEQAMAYAPAAVAKHRSGHVSNAHLRAELIKAIDDMLVMTEAMRKTLAQVKALAGRVSS